MNFEPCGQRSLDFAFGNCIVRQMLVLVLLGVLLTWYLIYYRRYVAGPAQVLCSDQDRRRLLEEHCPVLFQPFYPTIWAPQAHLQTIARAMLQTFPKHSRRRETVRLSDGGHVCLDWYNECSGTQPTLVILPGITGSSDENYVRHWIDDMFKQEYRCVVFNYRGCGNSKLSNTKMYCGANVEDLMEVLEHIHTAIPHATLMAVGVSLGSTQLIKYLSECKRLGKDCVLKAVLLVSALWDMVESRDSLRKCLNRHTLIRYLAFKYTRIMKENREVFEDALRRGDLCFDYYKTIKATSLEGLAKAMVLPMFGYSTVEEYLEDWSPCHRLDGITVPVLAVNASDDPFCPIHSLPVEEAERNRNLILVVMKRGGHIGFMEGFLPYGKSLMDRILVQFANTIFEHDTL